MTSPPSQLQFPSPKDPLPFTGERFVSGTPGVIEHEHYHRYLFPSRYCASLDVQNVACGEEYGSYLPRQCAKSVIGGDMSREATRFAQAAYESSRVSFGQWGGVGLPVETGSVDRLVSLETLEHLVGISHVRRGPGGAVRISTPNEEICSTDADRNNL
ncbi:MAG TPA: class I SAM-dependent methyltransferase [Rhodopila sp.]|uniref:class I SAM-dependent methyltransferase n=1 Tax=Rhodopila sp. TaxID=2480087 RepID=UPI002C2848B1|nr:class I SAM-dependent methyltransferase [Rhodopila sp.]HVY15053.1 class I SAM-dependent methyltransferase [Rhodopila sp.]